LAGVTHRFPGLPQPVLQDVSLSVRAGEFVALVGASGSGKSSLLRVLAGLLRPDMGRVACDGTEVTGRPGPERGMVFQADRLFPWRTALGNVLFALECARVPRVEAKERAMAALAAVGLARFAGHHPHRLSGGMRQRVNVARALALNPRVLLMDEPFSALDAQTREMMQAELLRIWERDRKAVVFVTHQIDEAVWLADRVVVLAASPGRVVRDIPVPLSRPRRLEDKRAPEFQAVAESVWREIEADVRRAFEAETHG
jgi:NitT/TauT family transport system ATP-binding protein